MSKHQYLVGNSEQLRTAFEDARAGLAEGNAIALEWKPVSNRSLSQNALLHVWCRELAESFTKRDKNGAVYSEADMKDLMKHKFLGYEQIEQRRNDKDIADLEARLTDASIELISQVTKILKTYGSGVNDPTSAVAAMEAISEIGDQAKAALGEGSMIGKTWIQPQLRSTKKLDKGAMFQFMEQVLAWSFQVGVMLSQPEDSEFMKLKESQHDT